MDHFLGEIRLVAFNLIPKQWALCNGQLMPINQNQALFALLGTYYGGNGQTTFALPDLCGRAPCHWGDSAQLGSGGGTSAQPLAQWELPQHIHSANYSNALANSNNPAGAILGKKGRLGRDLYTVPADQYPTSPASTTASGGSQPHNNMQPYIVLKAIIALTGIFPSPN